MITHARLQELLHYDPETGIFTWLKRARYAKKWNAQFAGKIAGGRNGRGYQQICIGGRSYLAHRLAWFYVHGKWPADQIDHINGDQVDNRLSNLREATGSENLQNRGKHRTNKSGRKGVAWHGQQRKWRAQIVVSRRQIFLGVFDCPDEAAAAYAAAAERLHGKFARTA